MHTSRLLFVAFVIMIFAGCGAPAGTSQQLDPSVSTEELAAILAERDAQRSAMLLPRKISAIEILSTRGEEALPILFGLAQDAKQDRSVRFMATEALGKYQQIPEELIPALFTIRRDTNGHLVHDLFDRTCKAAHKESVVPRLVEFVKDISIDYEKRQFVALTLLEIDEAAAVAAGVVKGTNPYLPNEKFMPDIEPVPQ
jgi:hypothetical protein